MTDEDLPQVSAATVGDIPDTDVLTSKLVSYANEVIAVLMLLISFQTTI